MSAIRYFLVLFIVIGALLCAGCSQPASDQNRVPVSPTPVPVTASVVSMSVPYAPIPVTSQIGENIAYELELVPSGNVTLVPEKVEVLDPATNTVLYSAGEDLLAELYHPASVPPPTAEELMNGTGKLVYPRISIWFTVRPGDVPDRLVHRVTLNQSAEGLAPLTVTGGEVTVRKDLQPVVIGSPMHGPGWVAIETTSPFTHHFRGQITMNGVTRVPQRFAQDWIYIDPVSGQVASGNVSLAKNFFGYGKEIYAVANGTVVDSLDGLPDIETIYSAPPVTVATAAGNYVIIDIGNNKYACYAHMIPGSVRVKTGDIVKEGDLIGLMGNSGNSDLPHLHFQVVPDTPVFLGAEGYPHEFRSFDVIGTINQTRANERMSLPGATIMMFWEDTSPFADFFETPVPRENSLPDNFDIVSFP